MVQVSQNNSEFQKRKLILSSFVLSILLMGLKFFTYYLTGSKAILTDAVESIVNVVASGFAFYSIYLSSIPKDDNHPYGHGKIEPLITFTIAAFLVVSATIIAYESIQNIQTPHKTPKPWTLIVLGFIIIWKEISFQIVIKKSNLINSSSLKADAWHHRSDAITSVMAFIGISIAIYFGDGYETADDWAALFASVFILYNSYLILRPALSEIMDEQLYNELIVEIRNESVKVKGVLGTEKCFIRKAGMKYHVDLHVIVDGNISVKEGHDIAHRLKDFLRKEIPTLGHVLIHIEPN